MIIALRISAIAGQAHSSRASLEYTMRYDRLVMIVGAAFTLLACADLTSVREPVGISVSEVEVSLIPGEEKALGAWLVDEKGKTVIGAPAWSSSDPTVATIDSKDGVVSAKAVGTATMTATFAAFAATTFVTVRPPNPPNTFSIAPAAAAVIAGGSDSLSAHAYDKSGRVTPVAITWSSADVTVATIDASGIVVGIGAGTTTITATAGVFSATVPMTVIALTSSLSFTRWTPLGQNQYATDVLSFTAASRLTQPIERATQFGSIAAPTWSVDGSSLVVEVIHGFDYDASDFWEDYSSDLYVLDAADSGSSTWRALTTDGFSKSPSWSPDGKRVAYLTQPTLFSYNRVVVLDVSTGVSVPVTGSGGWDGPLSWSPDGKQLALSKFVSFADYLLSNEEIFIVNVDGSGLTNVSNNLATDYNPSWSPDGRQLAFVSSRARTFSNPRDAVYVMNVDGSNVRHLTTGRDYIAEVAWSPDGQQIAFSAGGSIYVMNGDGSSPAGLTRPPGTSRDRSPSWRR
jgi:Tol biopolymer transport system component